MRGRPVVMAVRYKSFKHKIELIKKYEKDYKIEDLSGLLYMERR